MKLMHVSDLHFGKYLYGTSLIDDQMHWVDQFVNLVEQEKPDAILMAGDIYDRSVAPKEAIRLFDDLMTRLSYLGVYVMMIAGNHDSGIRLSSMNQLLMKNRVYIAGEVKKEIIHVTLTDEYGDVTFWLVPYFYPAAVEVALDTKGIRDYTDALQRLLEQQNIDYSKRNVILSHQSVLHLGQEPQRGGSEEMVGGSGGVDVSLYEPFDYAALGHIHAAQKVQYEHVRYAGSPLCYHFDELKRPQKGPLVVELKEKGTPVEIRLCTCDVLHPMRQIEGVLEDILTQERDRESTKEFVHVTLKDDVLVPGSYKLLENLFDKKGSYLMEVVHRPTNVYASSVGVNEHIRELSIVDGFQEFYKEKTNEYMDEIDTSFVDRLIERMAQVDSDQNQPSEEDLKALIAYMEQLIGGNV